MRTAQPFWLLALLFLALALAPAGEARFMDPLPYLFDPVTHVAAAPGRHLAGHSGGLVLALDAETGLNQWSNTGRLFPVRGLAVAEGKVLLAQSTAARDYGWTTAMGLDDGIIAWNQSHPAGVIAVAADAGIPVRLAQDGNLTRFSASDGSTIWQRALGAQGQALAFRQGILVAATTGRIHALDPATGDVRFSSDADATKLAILDDHVLALQSDGTLRRWRLQDDGFATVTVPPDLPTGLTALDAAHDRVLLGDNLGILYTYDAALQTVLPRLLTYANAVNAVRLLSADSALAGFQSGWVGVIPLREQPIVLALWPQPGRFVTSPVTYEWAYAHPTASDGEQATHTLQVRLVGETGWRDVAQGTVPLDRLTRLRSLDVDLGAFPSGTRLQTRIEVRDGQGRAGEDLVLEPFILDHEPPTIRGTPMPIAAEILRNARPTIIVGHTDAHSGIEPASTWFRIDGGDVGWQIERQRSFTRLTPTFDLGEGTHTWTLHFEDAARNWREHTSNFTVDTRPAQLVDVHVDTVAQTAAALSYSTDEPARCQARVPGGPSAPWEQSTRLQHAAFLAGLKPQTTYQAEAVCVDNAGRSVTLPLASFTTKPRDDQAAPQLAVAWTPALPDGANGWYTTATGPQPAITVLPTGTPIWWSLDQNPFAPWNTSAQVPPGAHDLRFFALTPQGASSDLLSQTIKFDPSPPPDPQPTWSATLSLLSWRTDEDLESGTQRYEVQGRTSSEADWQTLSDGVITWPGHRFSDVPIDTHSLRVVAFNGAGATTASPSLETGAGPSDTIYSIAGVVNETVGRDGFVLVNVRVAPSARLEQAILIDERGVFHPFSSERVIGPRLHQAFARASNFEPGEYRVLVEVVDLGTKQQLEAGKVTLIEGNEPGPGATTSPAKGPPVRRLPAPELFMLLLSALLVLTHRRGHA